jgi:PAS domain S-box-containing protein
VLRAEEYRTVFDASPDGILVVSGDGTITELNPQVEAVFGYEREELLGQPVEVLVPEALRGRHEVLREGFARNPRVRPMGAEHQLRGRRKDGSEVIVEVSLAPVDGEAHGFVVCTVRDVGDRIRLRDFSEAALRSAEEERRRIARELHDDTAQRLATLILRLRLLGRLENEAERQEEIDTLREQLKEAAEGVKRIARGLRPPALDEVGLATALQAHLRDLRQGANFEVVAEMETVDHLLDGEGRLALYRIVQESLSNVLRHAGVARAHLWLGVQDGHVVALVEDQGRGFRVEGATERGGGLGLLGMQERAVMFGGRVTIESAPGEGTRVRVELPGSFKELGHA